MMVKTTHTLYSKKFLEEWYAEGQALTPENKHQAPIGRHKVLKTSFIGRKNWDNNVCHAMAAAWGDALVATIISNRCTTLPGEEAARERLPLVEDPHGLVHTDKYNVHIPRPKVVEVMLKGFSEIDINDHFRQGTLQLECTWKRKKW